MTKRIWELDVFRGICILGVIAVHFVFDLVELYGIIKWDYPAAFSFIKDWGGVLFLLLSGVCATLGSRSVKRGLIVFACGLVCSAVTVGMYLLDFAGKYIIIWFGVLHCLGLCMIFWAAFKKLPTWLLALLGITLTVVGFAIADIRVESTWLFPLGLKYRGFTSSDYFPLLPNFGFFLIGAVIGRTLYRSKESLLPQVNSNTPVLQFLGLCGRQSLLIYLLHQPVLSLVCQALTLF